MLKTIVAIAVGCMALAGCKEPDKAPAPIRTVQPPGPADYERQFIKAYDDRRPAGDRSTDAQVLNFGRLICRKLGEDVHPDDLVRTLAFKSDNTPTGMSLENASELVGAAVAHLCPDKAEKLNK